MHSFLLGIYLRMELLNHGSRHMISFVNHANSPIYTSPVVNPQHHSALPIFFTVAILVTD